MLSPSSSVSSSLTLQHFNIRHTEPSPYKMATIPAKVILSGPSDWKQWYEDTMATVPSQMYNYFEPDTVAVLVEPVAPIQTG